MKEQKYLKWYNKIGYGSGDLAGNVVYAFLAAFSMFYLTDTMGLDMGIVGTLMALSKVLDAITDLLFGGIMDRTHTKMGKARPWMLWGYIGCAITLAACFAIPENWGDTAQYIFFFIAYTLLNAVFFTVNNIAYGALTALITKNVNERVQLGSFRFIFAFGTTMLIQYITVDAVNTLGGGAEGWRAVAVIYAVIGLAVNTLSALSVKELPEEASKKLPTVSLGRSCAILVKNRYFLLLCGAYLIIQVYASVIAAGIYYMKYILGDEGRFGTFSLFINIPMMLALIGMPLLIRRMGGMYRINLWGYLLATGGRLGVMLCGYLGSIPGMLVCTAVATLGIAPLQGDINALVAACGENVYMTTGHRLDGTVYSFTSFGVKIGGALGTPLCGWLLAAAGYVENAAAQTAATVDMLRFLYLWMPALLCAVMAFLLVFLRVEQANEKLVGEKKNEGV